MHRNATHADHITIGEGFRQRRLQGFEYWLRALPTHDAIEARRRGTALSAAAPASSDSSARSRNAHAAASGPRQADAADSRNARARLRTAASTHASVGPAR